MRRRKARFWVRRIYRERKEKGEFYILVKEAKLFDHELFFKMFRMFPAKFEQLLQYVAPSIMKRSQREPIGPEERLSITLRYLATGDAFSTIAASYRMSDVTVGRIIKETCRVLWERLLAEGYIKCPVNSSEWRQVAAQFETRWNFPNCVGAIDGKHVIIQCPPRGGSMFYNYKKFHSIVLMAAVDANYRFIMVDVGDYGRLSDGSVFSSCNFGYQIINDKLDLPGPRVLPGTEKAFPYVFVGDDAFPLRCNLIKPYPRGAIQLAESIANYRISRARRIVENAFGIATSRFRVFRRAITANVDTATEITKSILVLHNFLIDSQPEEGNPYFEPSMVDREVRDSFMPGQWRQYENPALEGVTNIGSNNYTRTAKKIRDDYRDYFNSTHGSVPWQMERVTSTYDTFDVYE